MQRKPRRFCSSSRLGQRGAAMVEFVVVGPIITFLGLAILQYSLMFFAKSQINHATFMAARAGSMANADVEKIRTAYQTALIPLYGGGQSSEALAAAYAKAVADLTADTLRVEVLNPTKESFDDYATDTALNKHYAARAIPNTGMALKTNLDTVAANSGQTLQDANLLKLRVTHGYEPKVWLIGMAYKKYLEWLDTGEDAFRTQLIASGRVPMVSHVTIEMQSDAVEQLDGSGATLSASTPGQGNKGKPTDPGAPAQTNKTPPQCLTMGCSVTYTPSDPGTGGDTGDGNCVGTNCPTCPSTHSTTDVAQALPKLDVDVTASVVRSEFLADLVAA